MNILQNDIDCNNRTLVNGSFQGESFKSVDSSVGTTASKTLYSLTAAGKESGSTSTQTITIKNGLIV